MKRAIVLTAPGTNNGPETRHALETAGASVEMVHINRAASNPGILEEAAALVIPGGFSYGDNLGAGKVFSLYLAYRLREHLERFISKGKLVMGVCNGFQALLRAGFLSGGDAQTPITFAPNEGGVFVCRWCRLAPDRSLFWFRGLPEEIDLPVANAEGKLTALSSEKVEKNIRAAVRYIDNPNGSLYDIAGITNPEGNVLGIMPHPERFIEKWHHPAYRSNGAEEAWGKTIYSNIIKHA